MKQYIYSIFTNKIIKTVVNINIVIILVLFKNIIVYFLNKQIIISFEFDSIIAGLVDEFRFLLIIIMQCSQYCKNGHRHKYCFTEVLIFK